MVIMYLQWIFFETGKYPYNQPKLMSYELCSIFSIASHDAYPGLQDLCVIVIVPDHSHFAVTDALKKCADDNNLGHGFSYIIYIDGEKEITSYTN